MSSSRSPTSENLVTQPARPRSFRSHASQRIRSPDRGGLGQEAAALAVAGITNSGGSSASAGFGGMVLVTSDGFAGHYIGSRFGRGVSVIAGEGTGMERDYEYSSRIHFSELENPETIGRKAAERAVRRLSPRKVKTGPVNVVLDPRVARGFAGHLAGAINGAAIARKTSFLKDRMGEQIFSKGINFTDDPLKVRGSASRPFDGEGIEGKPMTFVEDGVLKSWTLSTATARELGLTTNGRGVRGGSTVSPSTTNFALGAGRHFPRRPDPQHRNRPLRHRSHRPRRQHGHRRIQPRRVGLLDRKRRADIPGFGNHHCRKSQGHVPQSCRRQRHRPQLRHRFADLGHHRDDACR